MAIFGPLLILVSAVPGRGGALSFWLKGLIANALVFPAVFACFMFAGVILGNNAADWGTTSVPLFGGLSTELLRLLIAFGILLGIPAVPEMVRSALGVRGPQGFMQAAVGGFMGGVAVGQAGIGRLVQGPRAQAQAYGQGSTAARAGVGTAPAAGHFHQWYRMFGVRPH